MKKMTLDEKVSRREKIYRTAFSRKGDPITSLDDLVVMALNGRSIFCENSWGLLPAAAILNMPVRVVASAIIKGIIYEYPIRSLDKDMSASYA